MKPLFPVILRAVLTSVGVLGAMFIFTYLPQVAVLAFVTGPLGEFWMFLDDRVLSEIDGS